MKSGNEFAAEARAQLTGKLIPFWQGIRDQEYGYMVCVKNNEIDKVPLQEIAGKLKYVDPKSAIIRQAKAVGISFGDE